MHNPMYTKLVQRAISMHNPMYTKLVRRGDAELRLRHMEVGWVGR